MASRAPAKTPIATINDDDIKQLVGDLTLERYGSYEKLYAATQRLTYDLMSRHESVVNMGYYIGKYADRAAELRLCMNTTIGRSIASDAKFCSADIIKFKLFGNSILTPAESASFDAYYQQGFCEGVYNVSERLYEMTQMGDFKAVHLFLDSRGALKPKSKDKGAPVQISYYQDDSIDAEV